MKTPKVAVVVLNYKGWHDTLNCVNSLLKQTYTSFHIVLIENGSGDESAEKLSGLAGTQLTYLPQTVNHGFTGGVNIGIRWAKDHGFEAVALLNNDAVVKPDWLERLVSTMHRTQASVVTGLLLSEKGDKIDDAGDLYSTWGIPSLRAENLPVSQAPESGFIFGASGGATLYTTALFDDIGLFDEQFFAYNEDVDMDWRAQLRGHTIYYDKTAVAYHKHSATSKKMPGFTTMQVFKNLPLVFLKNVPFPMFLSIGIKFIVIYWAFIGYKILRGEGGAALKGVIKGIGLWPHALRERRQIQKSKTVSPSYIYSLLYKGLPIRSVKRLKFFFKHPFRSPKELDY